MTADDQFNRLKEKLMERRKQREVDRGITMRLMEVRKSQERRYRDYFSPKSSLKSPMRSLRLRKQSNSSSRKSSKRKSGMRMPWRKQS